MPVMVIAFHAEAGAPLAPLGEEKSPWLLGQLVRAGFVPRATVAFSCFCIVLGRQPASHIYTDVDVSR